MVPSPCQYISLTSSFIENLCLFKVCKASVRLTNSYHSVQKNANANITNVFPTFINFKEILCLLGMLNSSDIRILAFPSMRIIKKIVMEKMCHWLLIRHGILKIFFYKSCLCVKNIQSKAITLSYSCLGHWSSHLYATNTIHEICPSGYIEKKISTCTFCSIAICGIVLPILVGM